MDISWSEDYSTGIYEIDEQHKAYINILKVLKSAKGEKELFLSTLIELQNYIVEHFSTEDKFMKTFNYPNYDSHKKAHDSLASSFVDYLEKIANEDDIENLSVTLVDFLEGFISNHINVYDKPMAIFIKNEIKASRKKG